MLLSCGLVDKNILSMRDGVDSESKVNRCFQRYSRERCCLSKIGKILLEDAGGRSTSWSVRFEWLSSCSSAFSRFNPDFCKNHAL